MKKALFLLLVFNCNLIFSFDFVYLKYEQELLEKYDIKKIDRITYKINNKKLKLYEKSYCIYDNKSRIIKDIIIVYEDNKSYIFELKYYYDDLGNNTKVIQYYNDEEILKNIWKYNENRQKVSLEIIDYDNSKKIEEQYKYDNSNNIIRSDCFYIKENRKEIVEYEYINGYIIKEILYNDSNDISEVTEFKYDNNMRILEKVKTDNINNRIIRYKYNFINTNKFIKKVEIFEYDINDILLSKVIQKFYIKNKSKTTSNIG